MTAPRPSAVRPLVVIGAARSGTNLLRDLLAAVPGFTTWPCDEINPIWRHGNRGHPDDELRPEQADLQVQRFIRGRFARLARRTDACVVVEKTCANALRVAFVDRVLPEARFVLIERDGYDAVASALRRWHGAFDLRYTLSKAKFVPVSDLAAWGWRFLHVRAARMRGRATALSSWGPRFAGIDEALRTQPLPRVVAKQWARCVVRSRTDLSALPPARVHRVGYEDLVARPGEEIARLLDWCGTVRTAELVHHLVGVVRSDRVGHGRVRLGDQTVAEIAPIVAGVGVGA